MKHLCYNQWGPQVQRTPHTNRERPAKRALLIVRRVEWAAITGHTLYQDLKGSGRGMKERTYVCCDLKSFYASVECVERGLPPSLQITSHYLWLQSLGAGTGASGLRSFNCFMTSSIARSNC